jgi:hypothetical protein
MDPDIVNNTNWSGTIRNDLKSIPSFSIVMELADLFDPTRGIYANPSGDELAWERPGSLELIYPDGAKGFQINCGVRIRGGFSRDPNNPKHAFRFFFRQEYGEAKLHYPLFGDNGADTFDKIDLRTMQNYSWAYQNDNRMICLRDQFSRDGQLAMGQPAERGEFYHLYINGQYWGLYNTDERPEAAFGETYFGGQAEDYDTIKVDPDLGYNIEATDGNTSAWNRLWNAAVAGFTNDVDYFKIEGRNVDGTINTNYENLLDVDNLIDYMLIILYGGNLDAPISNFIGNDGPNNFFAVRNRTGQYGGFRFMSHDAEHTLLNVNEDRTGIVDGTFGGINADWTAGDPRNGSGFSKSSPQYVWFRLQGNAEFRLRVADRVQKYCFNGGVLTPQAVRASLLTRSNEIQRAIVCESARWGDAKRAVPFTRNDWVSAMNTVFSSFVNGRTTVLVNQLRADNLYPRVQAPLLNKFGGIVSNGFNLFMTNANPGGGSVIYYTLNGPDPRLRGGAVNASALAYTPGTAIPINFQTVLRARVLSNSVWSALVEATFYTAQDFSKLLVSEIMYNPPASGATPGDELEFLELKNTGTNIFDLSGVLFSSGINFAFTNGTRLGPGQFFVLGRNAAALTGKYPGLIVNGIYTGKLDNSGEKIALAHVLGGTILSFDYKDSGRWPVTADGFGFSLVPKNVNSNPDPGNSATWRASAVPGGSPGADDPSVNIAGILVNEALTHTVLPDVDRIELYNPTMADVNIGGWLLTDDRTVPMKFRIPNGTIIASHGYVVFSEVDFNPPPGTNSTDFALSSTDDEVYLFSTDSNTNLTGYSYGFHFGAAQIGVTFGRYVNSVGDEHFVAQISPTLGAANSGPRVGPVVFKQIMYHPPDQLGGVDNADDEYLLLENISGAAVPLFDPMAPTNTWRVRGGVDLNFPTNITLLPAGQLVLVHFDPNNAALLSAFRGKYGMLSSLPAYGPYGGKLDNAGQNVELYRPDLPNSNGVAYVLVEQIDYKDSAPWPPAPDGTGSALERVVLSDYGNDPTNWIGAAPLTISVNPRSQSVTNGLNYTNSVSAYGTGLLRYQWQFNGTDIPNATNAMLFILNVGLTNSGAYTVRVSDDRGSALSLPGVLTVLVKPVITLQPQSQAAVEGANVTLTVAASGTTPITFRWRRNNITFTNGIINSTPTNSSLTLTNVKTSDDGVSFNVAITNLAGAASSLSSNAILTVWADFDRDGLPDWWEAQFGLDTNSMADAALDPDHDTMSNLQEYIAGTDPHDGQSYLRIDADSDSGSGAVGLGFLAVSNKTYTVLSSGSVANGTWLTLTNVDAAPVTRPIRVIDVPPSGAKRYYRLVTPQRP